MKNKFRIGAFKDLIQRSPHHAHRIQQKVYIVMTLAEKRKGVTYDTKPLDITELELDEELELIEE